jgi:hypothetical protein
MTISANSGKRWRLAESQRAGSSSLPKHGSAAPPKAIACKQAPSPTSTTKFLIANLELEFRVTHSKQSTEAKSNRKKIAILQTDFSVALTSSPFSNRNCRSDQDRHPERPTGVEGSHLRHYGNFASGRSRQISNRNSRFTGFHSTCSKQTTKQISNRNKNDISGLSASLARHAFLPASPPCCLAATRLARYNSGSHIEVNQP